MKHKQWLSHARAIKGLATFALGLAVAVTGAALSTPAQAAATGIAATKHNLGSGPTTPVATGNNRFSGTTEICVFCHTPHGGDTTAAVPLWNRNLPTAGSFTTYDTLGTSTLSGKTAAVGSVSIACLSCHDGVTGLSVAIRNAPGPGTTGDQVAGDGLTWTSGAWSGSNVTNGKIASGITVIGTNLKDDHPVGIQYGGGGLTGAGGSVAKAGEFNTPVKVTLNGMPVWFLDANADGVRQKTEITLYTRGKTTAENFINGNSTVAIAATGEPFVECASCHDPHTETKTFLRMDNGNQGSQICLACHIK